jgi:hypothetical protein
LIEGHEDYEEEEAEVGAVGGSCRCKQQLRLEYKAAASTRNEQNNQNFVRAS